MQSASLMPLIAPASESSGHLNRQSFGLSSKFVVIPFYSEIFQALMKIKLRISEAEAVQ
jgi:hypothetical protein